MLKLEHKAGFKSLALASLLKFDLKTARQFPLSHVTNKRALLGHRNRGKSSTVYSNTYH
jgi:hypothetical protein